MQATQTDTQPKLSLHMLSSFAHIRNYILFYRLFSKIFCHSNKSIVTLKVEHENVRIRSLNNICSVYCYSCLRKLVNFIATGIISIRSRQRRGHTYLLQGIPVPLKRILLCPMPFFFNKMKWQGYFLNKQATIVKKKIIYVF